MLLRSPRILSRRCVTLVAIVVTLSVAGQAKAAVTSIGSVNPIPPTTGGTFGSGWVVGDDQATDPDTRAWVKIDNGTALQYNTLIVGDEEDFNGVLNVDGNFLAGINTKLTLSSAGSVNNSTIQIGRFGTGTLNVSGGTTVTASHIQSEMSIGSQTSGVGYVTVSDPFTMLSVGQSLIVGSTGIGNLSVLDGALVQTTNSNTSLGITIGASATGVGTAVVDGTGSVLRSANNLVVGGSGVGTLTVSNGGMVDVDNASNPTITVGPLGRLNLAGGTLVGFTPQLGFGTTVNGYLGGSGLVRGSIQFGAGSFLEAGPGNLLRFNGNVSNQGAATIDHGEMQFLAGFTNNLQGILPAPGRISLEDGVVRFSQTLTNNGVIAATRGTNNIHGGITNQGTIVVASNTVATFHDSVTNSGGTIQVLPRGNALFLTNLTFTSASALLLDVGSNGPMDTSARIGVAGAVTLGGSIDVTVDSSVTPTLGQTFDLITAAGGVSGTFATTTVPSIPGGILEFGVTYSPTSVQLVVAPFGTFAGPPGDFNGDFIVDAADYTVWQDTFGSTTSLAADASGNHVVDQADFDIWRIAFGIGGGAGGAVGIKSDHAVAEPSCGFLGLCAILGILGKLAVDRRRQA